MNVEYVPKDDFMPMQPLDEDSALTFRRMERAVPSAALAEEIEACILRVAKERFWKREEIGEDEQEEGSGSDEEGAGEVTSEEEEMDGNGEEGINDGAGPGRKSREATAELVGVPSADDEVSSAILRPSVGDIIGKLEKTLLSLHNMMVATIQAVEDDEEDTDAGEGRKRRTLRSLSRPRNKGKRPRAPSEPLSITTENQDDSRHASPQKKLKPLSSSQLRPSDTFAIEEETDRTSLSPSLSPSPSPMPTQQSRDQSKSPNKPDHTEHFLQKHADRLLSLTPRDWRAVLGAASIAGFSPAVITRATQRCASLFKEEVDLTTLLDHTAQRDTKTTIRPRPDYTLSSDEDNSDDELEETIRLRLQGRELTRAQDQLPHPSTPTSRQRSRTPASRRTPEGVSTPRSRSRSRSRSATPHLVCPYRTCQRSVAPFSKRSNLQRHIDKVHGGRGGEFEEVDSEDEMEDGVHVDGFLRGVRIRKGWRGEDVREEERGRRGRGRRGRKGQGEAEDVEAGYGGGD